jgi:hypothetical protein
MGKMQNLSKVRLQLVHNALLPSSLRPNAQLPQVASPINKTSNALRLAPQQAFTPHTRNPTYISYL